MEILGSLYASIINCNILCNLFHELGYVFTLLTVKTHQKTFNNDSNNANVVHFKSSDDCHYFASKTIQHLTPILMYMEKPIVNLILQQKIINTYVPELSKNFEYHLTSTVSTFLTIYHSYNFFKIPREILKLIYVNFVFYRIQMMI